MVACWHEADEQVTTGFLGKLVGSGLIFGQAAFDATYDLGDFAGPLAIIHQRPDGHGGFRVFRYQVRCHLNQLVQLRRNAEQ
jgi:hypothetical protein